MIKQHKNKILFLTLFLLFLWFAWPIYQFWAHRDAVPLVPIGWLEIPENAPATQDLKDPAYAGAGQTALEILENHRREIHAPGITAAVAVEGKVVWAGGSGWADIKTERPVTPATIFRVGSTSKAITATALARLVDQGVIDLDTPITNYLPDLPNPAWGQITPRQLASHMAGVPHYGDVRDVDGMYNLMIMSGQFDTMREALEVFDGTGLLFEPGTNFEYSSLGTVLLGAVMSGAANKPYLEIVRDEVFRPNKMTAATVSPVDSQAGGNFATYYKRKGKKVKPWRDINLSHRLPGGGFASTSADLVRMGAAWLDETYISKKTREAFWTQQTLKNGDVNPQGYAIGWRTREYEIEDIGVVFNANHGGVSKGAQSWLLVFPEFDMSLAFNINARTAEFHEFAKVFRNLARPFFLVRKEQIEKESPVEEPEK